MNEKSVLDRLRLPARLDSAQAAELLGFQEHDISVLVRAKLLHYLGKDLSPNSRKFFSSAELKDWRTIGNGWPRQLRPSPELGRKRIES